MRHDGQTTLRSGTDKPPGVRRVPVAGLQARSLLPPPGPEGGVGFPLTPQPLGVMLFSSPVPWASKPHSCSQTAVCRGPTCSSGAARATSSAKVFPNPRRSFCLSLSLSFPLGCYRVLFLPESRDNGVTQPARTPRGRWRACPAAWAPAWPPEPTHPNGAHSSCCATICPVTVDRAGPWPSACHRGRACWPWTGWVNRGDVFAEAEEACRKGKAHRPARGPSPEKPS